MIHSCYGVCRTLCCVLAAVTPALFAATVAPGQVVDEPVGARHSLGLTLWHLGHDPDAIRVET